MNKFDNYVYYNICEVAIGFFEKSKYVTFTNWCDSINNSLLTNCLNKSETKAIIGISNKMELIFSLGPKVTGEYIANFFGDRKCLEFEEAVRFMRMVWGSSIN